MIKSILTVALVTVFFHRSAATPETSFDPNVWVPTEYTEILNISSLTEWGGHFTIGDKLKSGFVGDTCNGESVFGINVAGTNAPIKADIPIERGIFSFILETTVWLVDSWDQETAFGSINDQEIFSIHRWEDLGGAGDYCGFINEDWGDASKKIQLKQDFSAQEFQFKLYSNTNSPPFDESLGMSEFKLWVAYCHPACESCNGQGNGKCIVCTAGFQKDDDGACIPSGAGLTISINSEDEFTNNGTFSVDDNVYTAGESFPGKQCSNDLVFGAGVSHGKIEGKFKIPARATQCALQMDVWTVDTWDRELMSITFEGQEVAQFAYDFNDEGTVSSHCGNAQAGDRKFRILSPMMAHPEGSEVTFSVNTGLDQHPDDESFGISNVKLFCEMCHPSCIECALSNDRLGCTVCPEGDLLHLPRDSQSGQCLKPTGACHQGYLNDNGICEEECDADGEEAQQGIQWLQSQDPELNATGERDYLHITFSTELPDTCYRGYLDIDASWDINDNIDTHMYPAEGRTKWRTDVYLMDSQLNDTEVCHTDVGQDGNTTTYTCELEFIGKFNETVVKRWKSLFHLTFQDDHFTNVEISETSTSGQTSFLRKKSTRSHKFQV